MSISQESGLRWLHIEGLGNVVLYSCYQRQKKDFLLPIDELDLEVEE
jgi:hypothetical protein